LEIFGFPIEKDDALFLMSFVEVIIGLHISRFWKIVLIMYVRRKKMCENI
jgi:hypothetical protein